MNVSKAPKNGKGGCPVLPGRRRAVKAPARAGYSKGIIKLRKSIKPGTVLILLGVASAVAASSS